MDDEPELREQYEATVILEVAIPVAEGDLVMIDKRPYRVQRLIPGEIQLSTPGSFTDTVMGLAEFKTKLREAEQVQFVR